MTLEIAVAPVAPGISPTADLPAIPDNLLETDGEPLESDWHRLAMNLLIEVVRYCFRARTDFFAGGNMFLYYSAIQVRNRDYRGPDFFFVWGVDGIRERLYWAVWEEEGKYPNVIVELLSPTTAEEDRTTKKTLYERTFRTPEYFLYDPTTRQLEGWRLQGGNGYELIEPEDNGRLWSRQLDLYLGTWEGDFQEARRIWLRFYDVHGHLVLMGREAEQQRADQEQQRADQEQQRADQEQQRAEQERQRADHAEAELAKLRARLAELEADRQLPGSAPGNA